LPSKEKYCINLANCYNGNTKDWAIIEEATGICYTEMNSLCFPLCADCIADVMLKENQMAKAPIEIAVLGEVSSHEVEMAISIANSEQDEFAFSRLSSPFEKELNLLHFRVINGDDFLVSLDNLRESLKGYHPYIIAIASSELQSDDWSNLFSVHLSEDGIAIVTTNNVSDVIISANKMVAYYLYYVARLTLKFFMPGHKNHEDKRECVFDFMKNKSDIVDSMKAGAMCDDCRGKLISDDAMMTSEQFNAMDRLFAKSGELLLDCEGKSQSKPRVFVGSSCEGFEIARRIQAELSHDFYVEIWNQDTVFGLGTATIEALESAVTKYDFGIFVFTPDDELLTRGETRSVARDNVIFEAGLFIGKLDRFHAFVVNPSNGTVSLPSDLNGLTTAQYDPSQPNLTAAMGTACHQIRQAINNARMRIN